MPLYWLVAVVIIIIIIVIFIIVITIIIKGAPLIWSEEAVTPLMVKSMNWMEEISVSIFSSWVSKLIMIVMVFYIFHFGSVFVP